MNITETQEAPESDKYRRAIERAATLPGHIRSGTYAPRTRKAMEGKWRDFVAWCETQSAPGASGTEETRTLSPLPASGETVAWYITHLLADLGLAPGTAYNSVVAIRAMHRRHGFDLDGIPAWAVLDVADHSPRRDPVKVLDRQEYIAVVEGDQSPRIGSIRDRCLATLAWGIITKPARLVELRIDDVRTVRTGLIVRVAGQDTRVDHDHDPVTVCPVEAMAAWLTALADQDITSGALFRPVDRRGAIEGGPWKRFGHPTDTVHLQPGKLAFVWRAMVRRAGVEDAGTPQSLRLGGARDAVDRGDTVGTVADRAQWSVGSPGIVNRLLPADELEVARVHPKADTE